VTSGQDGRRRPLRAVLVRRALVRRVLVAVAVLTMTGCGTAGSGAAVAPAPMSVSSEAFLQGGLAAPYTCHGAKINPPLNWSGAPPGTKSLALLVDDSSAPITPFIYWLVFDIGPGTADIQEGSKLPPGARQAQNSQGNASYDAPCPKGHPHAYRFTVYALRTVLKQANGAPLASVLSSIEAATIGRGRIVVTGNP
jgi:Raf kinase inhibitor-like YbhB/YbcL family protein